MKKITTIVTKGDNIEKNLKAIELFFEVRAEFGYYPRIHLFGEEIDKGLFRSFDIHERYLVETTVKDALKLKHCGDICLIASKRELKRFKDLKAEVMLIKSNPLRSVISFFAPQNEANKIKLMTFETREVVRKLVRRSISYLD